MPGSRLLIWLLCLAALWLCFWGGSLHPLASVILGSLAPLPVILGGQRLGFAAALELAIAVALLVFLQKPSWAALIEHVGFIEWLVLGVVYCFLEKHGRSPGAALVQAVLVVALGLGGLFLVQAYISGVGLQALLVQKSTEIFDTLRKLVEEAQQGGPGKQFLPVPEAQLQTLMTQLLPGLVIINIAMVAWLNVVLARRLGVLAGWGETQPPLSQWSNPEWLVFVGLGAGFLLLVPLKGLHPIWLNLLLLTGFLYFCQGVAVIAALYQRFQIPWVFRIVGYPLMFMNPLFFLVMILGLMDLWLDFRRLQSPKSHEEA